MIDTIIMFQEQYTIYIRQKAHYFPYIIQHNFILFVSGLFLVIRGSSLNRQDNQLNFLPT
jgi:hypothetical protein